MRSNKFTFVGKKERRKRSSNMDENELKNITADKVVDARGWTYKLAGILKLSL